MNSSSQTQNPPATNKSDVGLFNNPMVKAAMDSLSEQDKEKYREWGENIFGHIDFETSKAIKNMPPPVTDAVAYIEVALRSGLAVEDLDENEVNLMENVFGTEWKDRYNV